MTAFFIATSTIKNPEKFQQYAQQTGDTFAPYGGQPVLRGKYEGSLSTNASEPHQTVGIISFPSLDDLKIWFHSDAYQTLIPLRDEAAEMTITTYSAPV